MKSTITLGLALLLALLGALGGVPQADAVSYRGQYINYSGAICRHNNPEDAGAISYRWGAISSAKDEATYILCPLTRPIYFNGYDGGYDGGGSVRVYIGHTGPLYVEQTTTCTVSSLDYDGQVLAEETHSWTGTGSYILDFGALQGAGKSSFLSTYSMLCVIPGYSQGAIYGIQLHQYEGVD
jgi:hypothetical protein